MTKLQSKNSKCLEDLKDEREKVEVLHKQLQGLKETQTDLLKDRNNVQEQPIKVFIETNLLCTLNFE